MNRNVTLNLPTDLVRQAKVYAAQHDTTINALVRELLQEKLTREERVSAAINRLLTLAGSGPYFTLEPASFTRDQLHDRR